MVYGDDEFDDLLKDVIQGKRHACYHDCVEHAEEMSWHFYEKLPETLLQKVRPNEDTAITKYRLDNYEPITKSAADKSINILSKIFNPNLYSIRWKDDNKSSNELKSYSLEYYPGYNSIVTFTKDVLLRKMLADPNAVAVVTVDHIPENGNERLEPILKIYGSSAIVYYDRDSYLILTKVEEDLFYHFDYYDKYRTVSFMAWIKKNELNQEEIKNYEYNFDEVPVWQLRGLSEVKDNGEIMFKSFFSSAVPYWNDAIVHESDLKAAFIRHLFPQKYELSERCTYNWEFEGALYPCRGGTITRPGGSMQCPSCTGSGYKPISPLGVYRYSKDKLSEAGPLGVDPVGYINVPTDATKMLDERVDKKMRMGMWAINMDVEDKVGEVQSGVAKVIDRSAQYDMLYNISSVVFDIHITNFYYFANKFMFSVEAVSSGAGEKTIDKNLPEVNKPTQFDIGSVSELINNFKVAKESGLDRNFLQIKQIDIQSRDLTTNPDLKAFTVLILQLDPLPGMDQVDIDRNVTRGYVSKQDAVIHFNLKAFCERAILKNKTFMQMKHEEQIAILQKYADELIVKTKPTLDTSMIEDVTG